MSEWARLPIAFVRMLGDAREYDKALDTKKSRDLHLRNGQQ